MILTIPNLINSISEQLAMLFPDEMGGCRFPIRESPTQGTEYPCFFIFVMNPSIDDEPGERMVREIGFDIVFVQQRNEDNQNIGLYGMLEKLDEGFHLLNYTDNHGNAILHTNERNASIEDQELHYKFTIRARVRIAEYDRIFMMVMEEQNVEIKARA